MGIPRLTTAVNDEFYKDYDLRDKFVVIDGPCFLKSVASDLTKNNYLYGGDCRELYDYYQRFFITLKSTGVTPIVILDGEPEDTKDATEQKRFQNGIRKTDTIFKNLVGNASGMNSYNMILPFFLYEVFITAMRDCKITFAVPAGEADVEVAELARGLNCPVISNDSDFFIYDVKFIPVNKMRLTDNRIECQVFDRTAFLERYRLSQDTLYLLPGLVGNDHMDEKKLKMIQRHTGRDVASCLVYLKGKSQEQILKQLDTHGVKEALLKVASCYKDTYVTVLDRIRNCIPAFPDELFNKRSSTMKEHGRITKQDLEKRKAGLLSDFPMKLLKPGKNFCYMASFIEDKLLRSVHVLTLPIKTALYSYLLRDHPNKNPFTLKLRKEDVELQPYAVNTMSPEELFWHALGLPKVQFANIPQPWGLYIISLAFLVKQSKKGDLTVSKVHVQSLLLQLKALEELDKGTAETALLSCKIRSGILKPEIKTLHVFTSFQLCLRDIAEFATLLDLPYPLLQVHKLYCGTLLYGIYHSLQNVANSDHRFIELLSPADKLFNVYQQLYTDI